jgi:hypothetical protein
VYTVIEMSSVFFLSKKLLKKKVIEEAEHKPVTRPVVCDIGSKGRAYRWAKR